VIQLLPITDFPTPNYFQILPTSKLMQIHTLFFLNISPPQKKPRKKFKGGLKTNRNKTKMRHTEQEREREREREKTQYFYLLFLPIIIGKSSYKMCC
jgi:hypothetical protein